MRAIFRRGAKIVSFLMILGLLLILINSELPSLLIKGDLSAIREFSKGNMDMLLLLTLLLMIVQNMFTIIPLLLLISINVSLFGFLYGYLWSWITSIVAGVLAFLMARYWFQELLMRKLNDRIKGKIQQNGFAYVFVGRIFPFVPTSLINITAGVSTISLSHFTISTLLGNMIYMFVLSLIPLGILSLQLENYVYAILVVLFILGFVAAKLIRRKRKRKKEEIALQNEQNPASQ